MTNFVVGDSICVGIGNTCRTDIPAGNAFATGSISIASTTMREHFTQAISRAQRGDTVYVSAGYNGGISASDRQLLTGWTRQLEGNGVNVVFLGLREQWAQGAGGYERLRGQTPAWNNTLREIARETGAQFAESTIAVANSIPRGEIHGKSQELITAAIRDAANPGAAPAPTRGTPVTTTPTTPDATTGGTASAEADNAQANRNSSGGLSGILATLCNIPIIGPLLRGLFNLFGANIPEPAPAADAAPTTADSSATAPASDPARARALANGAAPRTPVTGGTTADRGAAVVPIPAASGPLVTAVGR